MKGGYNLFPVNTSLLSDRSIGRRIAVDFDQTIATTDASAYPSSIALVPGAKEALQELMNVGYIVIIYSARANVNHAKDESVAKLSFEEMVSFLLDQDVPYDEIYTGPGKPTCRFIIDDLAITFTGDNWPDVVKTVKEKSGQSW